jgi:uncharacterized protein (DUF362 family)
MHDDDSKDIPAVGKLNRRSLLLTAGAGLGALAAPGVLSAAPVPERRAKVAASTPRLVIARGPSPAKNVEALLARVGGMGQLVAKGDVVVIKPNAGWDRTPAQAANTDPEVIAALVRACRAAGAKEVIVCDNSVNDPRRSFERSGIRKAAEQAGARVILPGEAEKREREIPGKPGRWSLLEPLVGATKLINVPIAKHHGLTGFTCGMKNWIGAVAENRHGLHAGIEHSIAGLALLMRPTLTVVDATRVLLRNGPAGGNLGDVKRLDAVALSFDPVAVDAWAASELGFDPTQIKHLVFAEQKKLGKLDWRSLGPVELKT